MVNEKDAAFAWEDLPSFDGGMEISFVDACMVNASQARIIATTIIERDVSHLLMLSSALFFIVIVNTQL